MYSYNSYTSYDLIKTIRNKENWEKVVDKNRLKSHKNVDYEDLQVLLLEVKPENPQINTNEFLILERFWKNWFSDMGIEASIYQQDDNISITKNIIRDFLKKKALNSQ